MEPKEWIRTEKKHTLEKKLHGAKGLLEWDRDQNSSDKKQSQIG